jgi:hypothetical protein
VKDHRGELPAAIIHACLGECERRAARETRDAIQCKARAIIPEVETLIGIQHGALRWEAEAVIMNVRRPRRCVSVRRQGSAGPGERLQPRLGFAAELVPVGARKPVDAVVVVDTPAYKVQHENGVMDPADVTQKDEEVEQGDVDEVVAAPPRCRVRQGSASRRRRGPHRRSA